MSTSLARNRLMSFRPDPAVCAIHGFIGTRHRPSGSAGLAASSATASAEPCSDQPVWSSTRLASSTSAALVGWLNVKNSRCRHRSRAT